MTRRGREDGPTTDAAMPASGGVATRRSAGAGTGRLAAPATPGGPIGGAGGVPRRALGPLALCFEAAILGLLAMIAANRVDGGPDAVLLWVGWAAWAVSLVAAIVFAGRSGRLDGRFAGPDPGHASPGAAVGKAAGPSPGDGATRVGSGRATGGSG